MTCYDSKEGSFPISYKDCQLLADACEEQIIQMEKNLEEISPENICATRNCISIFLVFGNLWKLVKSRKKMPKKKRKIFESSLLKACRISSNCYIIAIVKN